MTDDLAAFVAARQAESDEQSDPDRPWPAVSFGIVERSFNRWDVCEYRNGFLHRTAAVGMPKRDAQLIRDRHIAALYSDHPDYRAEWKP